jgi:hypothetical protein
VQIVTGLEWRLLRFKSPRRGIYTHKRSNHTALII